VVAVEDVGCGWAVVAVEAAGCGWAVVAVEAAGCGWAVVAVEAAGCGWAVVAVEDVGCGWAGCRGALEHVVVDDYIELHTIGENVALGWADGGISMADAARELWVPGPRCVFGTVRDACACREGRAELTRWRVASAIARCPGHRHWGCWQ